jgi:glycosyltransferase involved in cell wall biosynthesis
MTHKILYVIDNLEFGGGERGFLQIIRGLNKKNFSINVAANPGGIFEKKVCETGTPFYPISFENRFNLSSIRNLRNLIKAKNFDIIHSQGARADFFCRISVSMKNKPYLISTVQMPVDGFNIAVIRKRIYQLIDRFSEKTVDCFIVVSDALANTLKIEHNIVEEKIRKIYNGIETNIYSSGKNDDGITKKIRNSFNISDNDFLIGSIGRLCWQKGFEYLIHSLPDVLSKYPNVKILLVGDGPLKNTIKDLTKTLNVEKKVIFAGFRDDVKNILSALDMLAVPSLVEGFPMIVLEAMAMQKPIVASKIEGIIEQLEDGKEGILIPARDHNSIANSICRIIENNHFAEKIGKAAREKVKKLFSVETMIRKTEDIYLSVNAQKHV